MIFERGVFIFFDKNDGFRGESVLYRTMRCACNMAKIETVVEGKVKRAIKEHKLFSKKERLAVAVSGGKDSISLLHILKKSGYNIEAVFIDLHIGNYSKENRENTENFCRDNKIKLHVIELRKELGASLCYIKGVLHSKGMKMNSCAICGVIKRYVLNKKSRELGFAKIATGHNLDDEVQSFLMNLVKGNMEMCARLGPISGINIEKKFVARVKPLYYCTEQEMEEYALKRKLPVRIEWCPCSSKAFRRKVFENVGEYFEKNKDARENALRFFLRLLPTLKRKFKNVKGLYYCEKCGEPAKDRLCRLCCILEMMKKDDKDASCDIKAGCKQ